MKSAILFACFFSVVMGNTETCKANDHSCVASASDEEEVNLMQVRAQVRRASNRHTYGPHKTQSALKYFVKWSHGKVANHMRNFIRTNPSKLALGQESAVIDKQCHKKTAAGIKSFVEMHRLRECRETAKTMRKAQFSLLDSYTDKSGVEHFVLRSNGALQYVAKHFSRVVAAYPELCPASKSASLRQKIKRVRHDRAGVHELDKPDLSEDKPEKGGAGKNLDPKSDQLVEDCKDLFHRTAKEKCDKDFELDVISAVEGVVAGLRVEMQIKVSKLLPNSSYATFFHDIACDFMTDDDSEDAKLLQKAPEKDDKDDKDEKDEKEKGEKDEIGDGDKKDKKDEKDEKGEKKKKKKKKDKKDGKSSSSSGDEKGGRDAPSSAQSGYNASSY